MVLHGWMNTKHDPMNKKTTLALTVAALATGAALGLLFAPASGRKTRRRIARKGLQAKDKINDLIEEGSEMIDKLKREVSSTADKARRTAQDGADAAAKAARQAASAAKSN